MTHTILISVFMRLWKPSRLILQPCSFPVDRRTHIYLPIFEIPGPQQKACAAHELKPLSIPPIASGTLRDPVFVPGSLSLTRNTSHRSTHSLKSCMRQQGSCSRRCVGILYPGWQQSTCSGLWSNACAMITDIVLDFLVFRWGRLQMGSLLTRSRRTIQPACWHHLQTLCQRFTVR